MGTTHLSTLALIHVVISLIGIVTGLIVVFGFLKPGKPGLMNTTFLAFTILTDITGFIFFPVPRNYSGDQSWDYFAGGVGHCAAGAEKEVDDDIHRRGDTG